MEWNPGSEKSINYLSGTVCTECLHLPWLCPGNKVIEWAEMSQTGMCWRHRPAQQHCSLWLTLDKGSAHLLSLTSSHFHPTSQAEPCFLLLLTVNALCWHLLILSFNGSFLSFAPCHSTPKIRTVLTLSQLIYKLLHMIPINLSKSLPSSMSLFSGL